MSKFESIRQQRRALKQSGVTMIEYALIAALIAVAAVITIGLLGDQINVVFGNVLNQMK